MNYCLRYFKNSKSIKRYDEILISYEDQSIFDLENFIQKYKGQRIIIEVRLFKFLERRMWVDINALFSRYHNLAICFIVNNETILSQEEKEEISTLMAPYFFSASISTWDQLHYYLNLGASDVYITENLGFDIEAVARLTHQHGAKVRVYPNVAQSSVRDESGLYKFFIRPEDIDLYSEYIDVLEFWGELSRQDILFHIYANLKKWLGNLNDLILDLNCDIDNKTIFPAFGHFRLTCRKECLRGAKRCNICNVISDFSKTLSENEYMFIKTKKKN